MEASDEKLLLSVSRSAYLLAVTKGSFSVNETLTADSLGTHFEIKQLIFPPRYRLRRFHLSLWLRATFPSELFLSDASAHHTLEERAAVFCPVSKARLQSSLRFHPLTSSLTDDLLADLLLSVLCDTHLTLH